MAIEEEIRELEQRFADSPESRLFLPLADALRHAGELERAVRICSRGLESYQDFTSARVLLALCLLELGRSGQAREQFERVLAEDSENFEALKGLGSLAAESGEAGRAWDFFNRARVIEPQDEEVLLAVKALDADQGGEVAAEEQEENPPAGAGEVFITHTLGDIYRLQGHYKRAVEVYSRLLERSPGDKILISKLEQAAGHLGAKAPDFSARQQVSGGLETTPETTGVTAVNSDDEVARRIDYIFESVLSNPSPTTGEEQENSPDSFVNMFERWIKGLRLLEAG